MSYFKILGVIELGLLAIHATLILTASEHFNSISWWIALHLMMAYFVFTEFYADVEKHAESSIKSISKKAETTSRAKTAFSIALPEFLNAFLGMCHMDHTLLYEEDEKDTEDEENYEKSDIST